MFADDSDYPQFANDSPFKGENSEDDYPDFELKIQRNMS